MRILHIITRLIVGGAQENTLYNVDDLSRIHGDEVTLATGPDEGPEGSLLEFAWRKEIRVALIPSLHRSIQPRSDYRSYRELIRLIDEIRPEVVHTHSSKAGIVGRLAAFHCQVPAVIHSIHGLPFHPYERWWKNRLYIAAEKWCAPGTDLFITVADAMIEQSVAAGIAPREKFQTIHSGMEVESFLNPRRPRGEVRAELGIGPDEVVVGKVARLFELKGHDDVIDAAVGLVQRCPNVRFLFVGGGAWRERLEEKIRDLGLGRYFRFTGLVPPERIPELLSATDLVVHASYREGLARVLPQALLSGKPVISHDIDGAREVVLPGKTGFLVAAGDIEGLRAAMEQLVEDPSLRQRMGQKGRELFTETFRHETMTRRIRDEYSRILARRSLPGRV